MGVSPLRFIWRLFLSATDIEAEGLKAAIIKFENLVEGLPLRRQGPKCQGASGTIGKAGGGSTPLRIANNFMS